MDNVTLGGCMPLLNPATAMRGGNDVFQGIRHMNDSRIRGCLLGGAVGDALGAPVEFLSSRDIRIAYGPGGIRDFAPAYGRVGAITDDTQMTLFTAEGLLRAFAREEARGMPLDMTPVHHAYLRWLWTQGMTRPEPPSFDLYPGWLVGVAALHDRRGPGNTCLSALRSGRMGTIAQPLNDSKGCGGVMRVAPVGLVDVEFPFLVGAQSAAITHGHPTGYLAAGALALMIASLRQGRSLRDAYEAAMAELNRHARHEETTAALRQAAGLARAHPRQSKVLETLGAGWVAEEALAIAVYCAFSYPDDLEAAVTLAVNHGGDSDSTGAITGNIMGALLGAESIPARWLERLELREEIELLARDLAMRFEDNEAWWRRYPGH